MSSASSSISLSNSSISTAEALHVPRLDISQIIPRQSGQSETESPPTSILERSGSFRSSPLRTSYSVSSNSDRSTSSLGSSSERKKSALKNSGEKSPALKDSPSRKLLFAAQLQEVKTYEKGSPPNSLNASAESQRAVSQAEDNFQAGPELAPHLPAPLIKRENKNQEDDDNDAQNQDGFETARSLSPAPNLRLSDPSNLCSESSSTSYHAPFETFDGCVIVGRDVLCLFIQEIYKALLLPADQLNEVLERGSYASTEDFCFFLFKLFNILPETPITHHNIRKLLTDINVKDLIGQNMDFYVRSYITYQNAYLYIKEQLLTNNNPEICLLYRVQRHEDFKLYALPPVLAELTNLVELNLTNHCLSDLPDCFIHLENLVKLVIRNNLFTIFPDILFVLKSLKKVDFRKNNIFEAPMWKIEALKMKVKFKGNPCDKGEPE